MTLQYHSKFGVSKFYYGINTCLFRWMKLIKSVSKDFDYFNKKYIFQIRVTLYNNVH